MFEISSKKLTAGQRSVSFRAAAEGDESLLRNLYASTRSQEMALTGWNQAQQDVFLKMQFNAQQAHYRSHYPDAEHLVILLDGQGIGRIYIADKGDEIRILDLTILPSHRGGGIGALILNEAMSEATTLGKPLTINIESDNPSLSLFERLGFHKAENDGYRYLMKFQG